MADPNLDRCLVVGAEETDWLLCDAYRKWRLLRPEPPIEPFARPPKGMILSEGAGAVLLARKGDLALEHIHAGGNFAKQSELVRQLDMICGSFPGKEAEEPPKKTKGEETVDKHAKTLKKGKKWSEDSKKKTAAFLDKEYK